MARPIPSRRRTRSDSLVTGLAVALAALIGWNLAGFDWSAINGNSPRAALFSRDAADAAVAVAASANRQSARFGICGGGARITCVVDGDTFWLNGEKIRIADIDTPEISKPRCPAELNRGNRARDRLAGLLNAGPFDLETTDRAQDHYGRSLYIVTRGGGSLGQALVDEGLAVWYGNGRPDWC